VSLERVARAEAVGARTGLAGNVLVGMSQPPSFRLGQGWGKRAGVPGCHDRRSQIGAATDGSAFKDLGTRERPSQRRALGKRRKA
jgi:hypothetical protein